MSDITLMQGDCLDKLKELDDNSVDSIVTDPPYGLSFMGKAWDKSVPSVEVWEECLRVLKPGGHLLSFAGTRTQHRMAVNIEDAGFEIRDMVAWVYGSGFPKSQNVGKAIDKAGGKDKLHLIYRQKMANEIRECREKAGISRSELSSWFPQYASVTTNWERIDEGFRVPSEDAFDILVERLGINENWRNMVRAEDLRLKRANVKPDRRNDGTVYGLAHEGTEYTSSTEAAQQWDGWGTALKPALEPITVARKPLIGTVAANVMEHGTGAINIDGCRVNYVSEEDEREAKTKNQHADFDSGPRTNKIFGEYNQDRENYNPPGRFPANLIHDGSDEVVELFPQTGKSSGGFKKGSTGAFGKSGIYSGANGEDSDRDVTGFGDKGSAARFFYCPKANKKDRNEGLTQDQANKHPTVKPTDLMRYLCRLVTPPGGTVLDPFMGSGSTGKAARLEGFDFIGIELDPEYVEIARARIGSDNLSNFFDFE